MLFVHGGGGVCSRQLCPQEHEGQSYFSSKSQMWCYKWREIWHGVQRKRRNEVKLKGPRQLQSRHNVWNRVVFLYRLTARLESILPGSNPGNVLWLRLTLIHTFFWDCHFTLFLILYNMVFLYFIWLYTCHMHKAVLFEALVLQIIINNGIWEVFESNFRAEVTLAGLIFFLDLVLDYRTS